MLRKPEFDRSAFLWRISTAMTVVSGLFSVVVFILLVVNYLQVRAMDPINNTIIAELRDQYAAASDDEAAALAQRIRDLDLLTRKAFFTSQHHLHVGGLLLLAGVIVFLVAFKSMARWRQDLPAVPETPPAEIEWLSYATSRHMISWAGVIVLAVGLLASYMTESALEAGANAAPAPTTADVPAEDAAPAASASAPAAAAYPSWDVVLTNWPSFRGPGAFGVAHFTTAPMDWDIATGKGVRWTAAVPKPGANSPVVWGTRLYLAGADETTREVYCFDTETGELLWQRGLESFENTSPTPPKVSEDTGYAASTMAVHGDLVFTIFANGDIAGLDQEGNPVWGFSFGLPVNHYGHSSSLIAYENLLYVQMDTNENPRLLALDVATGKEAWVAKREKISWSSPILAHTSFGPQLILCSEDDVDAYDPETGDLIWTQECLGGEVAPSAAYAKDMVFAANEYATSTAIKLTGTPGSVQSEILWQWDELLPEVSSPIGDGDRFYFGTAYGDFVALNAATGEEAWVEELSEGFYSSPVLVGDRIYILDKEGIMYIIKSGAEFELIGKLPTGEPTFATPAYLDGRIYLRTFENLYCIE